MLPTDPTDVDIEAMVIDALERLPAPFRDQLGWVAIVIEDEAVAGAARVGRRPRSVRALPGRAADASGPPMAPSCPARSRSFADRSSAPTGRRSALAAAVTDTVYHEIAHHFGISDARLHELQPAG